MFVAAAFEPKRTFTIPLTRQNRRSPGRSTSATCWHIASGQAEVSLLLVLGPGSFGEISANSPPGVAMATHSSTKSSSETSKVKTVNLAYYKALSARDLRAMEAVWTCAADNILIAPPARIPT